MTLSGKPRSPVASTTNPGLTSFMAASSKRKSAGKVLITRPVQSAAFPTGTGACAGCRDFAGSMGLATAWLMTSSAGSW